MTAVSAAPLPEVKLPPLKKTRVAIFNPDPDFPRKPIRDIEWFETELAKLNLKTTRLSNSELIDTKVLNTKRFDTLFLPVGHMPFEAEYSIYEFLKAGGNLVTVSCTPTTWNKEDDGTWEYKQHRRGWFAPFLIRHLDFRWAQRKVSQAVGLNPKAAKLVGNLLPATAGPFPERRYSLVDRWDLHPATPGRMGDTDVSNGQNVFLAADVMLPLYRLPNREATDFHVYRFFNNRLFGSTLVELGAVGTGLLVDTDKGPDILKAVFHFAENKLPGEGSPDYYKRTNQLHIDWSNFGDTFVDTLAELRDAAYYSHLTGSDAWKRFSQQSGGVQQRMACITKEKNAWDNMILNGSAQDKIDAMTRELTMKLAEAARDCLALQSAAKAARESAQMPAKVAVKSPYGGLLVEGFLTLPENLSMYRSWHFPAMKEIGVNVYSKRFHTWYKKDPAIRKNVEGIALDLNFQYGISSWLKPHSGELKPADGTIKDDEPQEYDYAEGEAYIKNNIDSTEGYDRLRIGLAHETGLGLKYWGSQAEQDFHAYLAEQYTDIAALNKHWGTQYRDFESIKLPTQKPTTPSEHALWENWRNLREAKFEYYHEWFYKTVKKLAPDLAVSGTVSTGSLQSPLYGVNFYNVTKYQDISGIDGTAVNPPKEWLYLDLTKKRVLTAEWGGLYQPKSLSYVNAKLWEELTGGTLGFNLWLWRFGNHECNYVNYAGLTTLYGSQARVTVKDAKTIEHVIMDGERTKPEVGILFSQTTRVHDQGWGGKGEPTFSPHIQAVINYYAHFLKFHRSARVIAEEKLLEEGADYLKMLIVPQATFLSKAVQEKLVEYAENGGTLLLEGRVGQFDNFGQPLDLLFRKAQTVPAYVGTRMLTVGKTSCAMAADDALFAPNALDGKGRVLATFGSNTAVLVRPLGKGEVIVAGMAAGLRQYPVFGDLISTIWRDQKLSPRFVVSDDAVLLREWRHGSDTYLLLTSRIEQGQMAELNVKVRGKCRVEDYLFGKDVKSEFDGSYTTFTTLMGNGARVFRIPGGAASDSMQASAAGAEKMQASAEKDNETTIELPFTGWIYARRALKWGDYTFRNSTIASGIDPNQGETYLTITKGDEVQKKRIITKNDYFFRMRDTTFKVHCEMNFYKFPFHSEVIIETVTGPIAKTACEMKTADKALSLSSGLLRLTLAPNRGGWIREIALADDQINQVAKRGALSACTENLGQVPGPFIKHTFDSKVVKNSEDEIVLELVNREPIERKTLRKRITVRRGVAGFDYNLKCTNHDTRTSQAPFELRWHPELAIGGLADGPDMFAVPTPEGLRNLPYHASNSGMRLIPGANWAAVVDRSEKVAYVTTFVKEPVENVYLWMDMTFYDMEIFSVKRKVQAGDSIDMDLGIYMLRGVRGLDVYQDGFGAHAALPDSFDQQKRVRFGVEAGSAYETILPVKLSAELKQGDRRVTDFGGVVGDTVAFDQPINRIFEDDLKQCADGAYTLHMTVTVADKPSMTIVKGVRLTGGERAGHLKYYDECKKRLQALATSAPAGSEVAIFNLRASLEELRSHIAAGRLAEATAQREKLAKAIEELTK